MGNVRGDDRHAISRLVQNISEAETHQLSDIIYDIENKFINETIDKRVGAISRSDLWLQTVQCAEEWIKSGIYLLTSGDFEKSGLSELTEFHFLFAKGSKELLCNPKASILNSRRSRRITPSDNWLQNTRAAVSQALRDGFTIVSSLGTVPYSLVTAASKGNNLILVCVDAMPFMKSIDALNSFFAEYSKIIDDKKTLYVSAHGPKILGARSAAPFMRDRIIGLMSDEIFAVDIRKKGNMAKIVREAQNREVILRSVEISVSDNFPKGSHLDPGFGIKRDKRERVGDEPWLSRDRQPCDIEVTFNSILGSWLVCVPQALEWLGTGEPTLFHYTRYCYGPWPGQTCADYVNSLLDNQPGASHTAFDTVVRICLERRLRASGALIRGQTPVVSFTEVVPSKLSEIQKWRTGFYRWSLEPYGIGIKRKSLIEKGARQVIYGPVNLYREVSESEKYLFQVCETKQYDWSAEKEWRVKGDLDINKISINDLAFVVPTRHEAQTFASVLTGGSFLP